MPIFVPKPGTILSRNNLAHATWGIATVAAGNQFGGGKWATIATVGISAAGLGWELLNTTWPKGAHMHADYKGLLSFVVPALAARALVHLVGK